MTDATDVAAGERINAAIAELAVPIGELRPFDGNPRRGDVATIRRSLERNGQYRPIVVRRATSEVLAGNHTLLAALELGWTEVAATFVDVDDETARRIVLVDNRSNDVAGYDDTALAQLLQTLDELDGSGFRQRDLDRLLDELARSGVDAGADTDPIAPPATPSSKRGDLYRLGEHRLLCGDSRSPDDVARLLGGELAEMVWTDPPYGVDYHGRGGGARVGFYGKGGVGKGQHASVTVDGPSFANDYVDPEKLYELVHAALGNASEHTRAGGAIYVAHPDGASDVFRRATRDGGWDVRQVVVWVKQHFVLTRQDYNWQHEPILYGWKPGAGHAFYGGHVQTTLVDDEVNPRDLDKRQLLALVRDLRNARGTDVIRYERPARADLHPTMKPVGLVAVMLANSSRRGELVLEPFGGSGTTMIAAENLERRAALIEFEPGYCDVIVDRWQRHTGRKAERERPSARRARAAV